MNRCFTTIGYYEDHRVSPQYSIGSSISREEQIKRLEALKSAKWVRESKQMNNSNKK